MSRTAKEIETTGLPCEAQNGETIQVVPKIDVTMFGKFTLKQEGMEVPHAVSLTGRSRRLWTLTAYLILNRNRGVSAQELIDLLWPEAENDNPLSTLQNNVSRARAALAELGFTHAKVIIHNEKGYYRWAPDRETQLLTWSNLKHLQRQRLPKKIWKNRLPWRRKPWRFTPAIFLRKAQRSSGASTSTRITARFIRAYVARRWIAF